MSAESGGLGKRRRSNLIKEIISMVQDDPGSPRPQRGHLSIAQDDPGSAGPRRSPLTHARAQLMEPSGLPFRSNSPSLPSQRAHLLSMFCIKLGANVTTNPALISFLRGTHENSASSYTRPPARSTLSFYECFGSNPGPRRENSALISFLRGHARTQLL